MEQINLNTLTAQLELLSNDVKSFMILPTSNIYYALSDRTINLVMKGKIDTNAIIGGPDGPTFSDAEISALLEHEQEVLLTVVKMIKQDQVVPSHI